MTDNFSLLLKVPPLYLKMLFSLLKPVSKGMVVALAECLRAGKNVLFCESKIRNEEGELVCVGTSQLLRI